MLNRSHDEAQPSKENNLGHLFYTYIKKMEEEYPGILAQLGLGIFDKTDACETTQYLPCPYKIGSGSGRLYHGLEVLPAHEPSILPQLEIIIAAAFTHKSNRELLTNLKNDLENIRLEISEATITNIINFKNRIISILLPPPFYKKLGKLLEDSISDRHNTSSVKMAYSEIRCKARLFIHRAIIFSYCTRLSKQYQKGTKNPNRPLAERIKLLKKVVNCDDQTPITVVNTLITQQKKEKADHLETKQFCANLENKKYTFLKAELDRLEKDINDLPETPDFKINPNAMINVFLEHFFKCFVALNSAKENDSENKTLTKAAPLLFKLSTQFIKTHQILILKDECNRLKASGLIKCIQNSSLTEDVKILSRLQRKISPKDKMHPPRKKNPHKQPTMETDETLMSESSSYSDTPDTMAGETLNLDVHQRRHPLKKTQSITYNLVGLFAVPSETKNTYNLLPTHLSKQKNNSSP